jgi:hypothetical protein
MTHELVLRLCIATHPYKSLQCYLFHYLFAFTSAPFSSRVMDVQDNSSQSRIRHSPSQQHIRPKVLVNQLHPSTRDAKLTL